MTKSENNKIVETFFSHDKAAKADKKIVKMFYESRKNSSNISTKTATDLLPHAAYGLYWEIVEYMHRNRLKVEELDMLADELRVDYDFLKAIMDNYSLFRIEDDYYVSDRINRNLEFQATKNEKRAQAATIKWKFAELYKVYKEIFGIKPELSDDEKNIYLKATKIENWKEKLPNVLYTLKLLKFPNLPNFDPSINWLLAENHLQKLLNGEYGKLLNWSEAKIAQAQKTAAKEEELRAAKELEDDYKQTQETLAQISSKAIAIETIIKNTQDKNFKIILPQYKDLMSRFDITVKELKTWSKENGD